MTCSANLVDSLLDAECMISYWNLIFSMVKIPNWLFLGIFVKMAESAKRVLRIVA